MAAADGPVSFTPKVKFSKTVSPRNPPLTDSISLFSHLAPLPARYQPPTPQSGESGVECVSTAEVHLYAMGAAGLTFVDEILCIWDGVRVIYCAPAHVRGIIQWIGGGQTCGILTTV